MPDTPEETLAVPPHTPDPAITPAADAFTVLVKRDAAGRRDLLLKHIGACRAEIDRRFAAIREARAEVAVLDKMIRATDPPKRKAPK
jgi:hypothetical protein